MCSRDTTPHGVQLGDRIRLTKEMREDPCPIAVGSEGIVNWLNHTPYRGGSWQVGVDWADGRTLGLVVPADEFEIVNADECRWCGGNIWPTGRDVDGQEWQNGEGETSCSVFVDGCLPHEPIVDEDETEVEK